MTLFMFVRAAGLALIAFGLLMMMAPCLECPIIVIGICATGLAFYLIGRIGTKRSRAKHSIQPPERIEKQ